LRPSNCITPPSAMPPLTGDQGECGTHTATTRSLSQA
jgi:hypothetical protein